MIFHAAALALALQPSKISYRLIATTEVRSPVAPSGTLIQDKRTAYDFFLKLKPGAVKPLAMKRIDWSKQNVLVIYPGFIQKDAKVSIAGIVKRGSTLHPYVSVRRGITAETFYPAMILAIPRQPLGTLVHADIEKVSVIAMRTR